MQTPDMYADVPPAPPGLIWWEYKSGVPPLPQPVTYFGLANWTNWGWRYDPTYTVPFYQFSNLDQVGFLSCGIRLIQAAADTAVTLTLTGVYNACYIAQHAETTWRKLCYMLLSFMIHNKQHVEHIR